MCETRAICDIFAFPPFCLGSFQVMSQTSQAPVEIDLGFSDDMSEDLAPFSDVPLPPAPSRPYVEDISLLLGLRAVLFHSHPLQCITDLVHESSQSVIGPTCNAQSPWSSPTFSTCVHVEAPAGECMICPQSVASSLSVPCCRQRVHCECLARSVRSCVDR